MAKYITEPFRIKAVEPSFGLEALWISKDNIEEAELRGYTIVDPSTILVTHLLEIINKEAFFIKKQFIRFHPDMKHQKVNIRFSR